MTTLLYISYGSDKSSIDRSVSKNREKFCIILKTFVSNAKDRTKKVIVVIILKGALYFCKSIF